MFNSLSDRLGGIFDSLTRRGVLKEQDVDEAMREIRVALLEADVALPVVRDFIDKVKPAALGREVLRSVTPGQMVVKIVHDEIVAMLGDEREAGISLAATPPVAILLVGLQGSGKTTSAAKLGLRLKTRDKQKVLMASLDVYRPAAQQQLAVLGEQADVATLPIVDGQQPVDIAKRAMQAGRLGGYDVVILDTAGRLHVDEMLMEEVAAVRSVSEPHEVLLVADAMTGQDAVTVAENFNERLGLTGILLTRVDGDARGGAALSMRAVTGCPIKMIGVGEKLDKFEPFHPDRIANRILGMGDVVSLVEKVSETVETEKAEKLAKKLKKGEMDLDDLADQLDQLQKMGGLGGIMGMLPGVAKAQKQMAEANIDETMIRRQRAIISSMTRDERSRPKLIQASRKRRIAAGSGTSVQDVNKLLKQFQMMNKMMKKAGKMGSKGMMRHGLPGMPPGGLPPGFG
ncbi:MAG: signal recognition particle protein [Alphaproteobacteria bacterium]|jgi:signal recognition particle subunit SRP54|nr:signal recognition particle protein [Alphaproteobacteria bacterium]